MCRGIFSIPFPKTLKNHWQIEYDGHIRIADAQFYFYIQFDDILYPLAMVTLFSPPDAVVLDQSSSAVYLCDRFDIPQVIPVTSIKTVVSMVPELQVKSDGEIVPTTKFSLLRHPFIDLAKFRGDGLFDNEDDEDDMEQ
jgi:hypothetical protein